VDKGEGRCWISLTSGERFKVNASEGAVQQRIMDARNGDGWLTLPNVPGTLLAVHVVRTYPEEA
jgi:hypothetical protein